jgi:hypothetical protein
LALARDFMPLSAPCSRFVVQLLCRKRKICPHLLAALLVLIGETSIPKPHDHAKSFPETSPILEEAPKAPLFSARLITSFPRKVGMGIGLEASLKMEPMN